MRKILTYTGVAVLLLSAACSDDGGSTGISSDRVTDPMPLALGNSWEYSVQQDAFITPEDTTRPQIHYSSGGSQKIEINRTESVGGDEAYGLRYLHVMEYIFTIGADTTEEIHYLAPRGDKLLLKAITSGYNTGGFIPFGAGEDKPERLAAKVKIGGKTRYVPLEQLARTLLDPEPTESDLIADNSTALASDGIRNDENTYYYDYDYVLLYDDLYKGRNWISSSAQGVGGVEISRKVTNILPELGEYSGPIAEVEEINSLIESVSTTSYKLRFYYKSGVGIVQAEIYDTDFFFYRLTEDGPKPEGYGTWQVVKKLVNYKVN